MSETEPQSTSCCCCCSSQKLIDFLRALADALDKTRRK